MVAYSLREVLLDELITRCREEAHLDRGSEVGYCFELFRRALEDKIELAWHAIQAQYGQLVLKWIYSAARPESLLPEDAEELQAEAFTRFWRTLDPRSSHLAGRFPHVGALLRYLNQCSVTSWLDRRRQVQRRDRLADRLQANQLVSPVQPGPEQATIERVHQEERLSQVLRWLESDVTDPKERLVIYLSYEQDMLPAEIADQFAGEVGDAREVRRIKERVLKRAKRALSE